MRCIAAAACSGVSTKRSKHSRRMEYSEPYRCERRARADITSAWERRVASAKVGTAAQLHAPRSSTRPGHPVDPHPARA